MDNNTNTKLRHPRIEIPKHQEEAPRQAPTTNMADIELFGKVGTDNILQKTRKLTTQDMRIMEEKYHTMRTITTLKKKVDWYEAGSVAIVPTLTISAIVCFFVGMWFTNSLLSLKNWLGLSVRSLCGACFASFMLNFVGLADAGRLWLWMVSLFPSKRHKEGKAELAAGIEKIVHGVTLAEVNTHLENSKKGLSLEQVMQILEDKNIRPDRRRLGKLLRKAGFAAKRTTKRVLFFVKEKNENDHNNTEKSVQLLNADEAAAAVHTKERSGLLAPSTEAAL